VHGGPARGQELDEGTHVPLAATGAKMTTKLNENSYAFAQDLVKNGQAVRDQMDDWSEHQPSSREENDFIDSHGWDTYANWHLGIEDEESEHAKARYKYPYGDFSNVHRCGVLAAEVRSARLKNVDIENAAIRLRDFMDQMSS